MIPRHLLAITLALSTVSLTLSAADELAIARDLYASAAYEEALAALGSLREAEAADLVEQYRALCFLALGRNAEAEHALATIVTRRPLYELDVATVSPKLVEMFQAVRRRSLPQAARALYAQGKASFDAKRFDDAAAEFRQLLAVTSVGAVTDAEASWIPDLRTLGEGFLELADGEIRKATRQSQPAEAASQGTPEIPVIASAPEAEVPQGIIHTASDSGIVPPVEIEKALPRWAPGNPLLRNATFRGVLEIVIDEQGAVESAAISTPISPLYDARLLDATASWRFRPATMGGKPVKYRKAFEIVLQPTKQ